MARGSGRDEGQTYVLEAVILSTLMVTSVAFVAGFETPPTSAANVREQVRLKADDALAILYDTPVSDSAMGDNALSVGLMECLQGDCSLLESRLGRVLPEGAVYALYVSNGQALHPLIETRTPSGEAVTSRRLVEPAWSYNLLASGSSLVNPLDDPLVVYSLPVLNSNPITPQGNRLLVRVEGVREGDNAEYVMRASVTTRAALEADAGKTSAASLYFHDGAGNALASLDARGTTLDILGLPSLAPFPLRLRLEETAGVAVPAGTVVTVHMPSGWSAVPSASSTPGAWQFLENATDANSTTARSDFRAQLLVPVSSGPVDLVLDATYHGEANDHYPVVATLSRGVYGKASLLVRADAKPVLSGQEIPLVLASVPRPMGATAPTTWTLSALVPESPGAGTSERVRVTRVTVQEEQGLPVFGSVAGLSGANGTWTNEGDRLVWEGDELLTHSNPLSLVFQVTGSGLAEGPGEQSGFVPTVQFEGWPERLLGETSPGLFRDAFLPQSGGGKGYNGSTGSALTGSHVATSSATYRTTPLPGSLTYTVGLAAGLRDSLVGSDVSVSRRFASTGDEVGVDVRVQSVFYRLVELGFTPEVRLRVHPPWLHGFDAPLSEEVLLDGAALAGGGLLSDVLDLDGDGVFEASSIALLSHQVEIPATWLFGPYLVEVEVRWAETVSGLVGGLPTSLEVTRSTSLFDYFVVTPPGLLMPPSPVYDVHLVVWFEDWG